MVKPVVLTAADRRHPVVVLLEEVMHPQAVVRQVVEKAAVLMLSHPAGREI